MNLSSVATSSLLNGDYSFNSVSFSDPFPFSGSDIFTIYVGGFLPMIDKLLKSKQTILKCVYNRALCIYSGKIS